MRNPVTTILSVVVALGVIARAVTLFMAGQAPDWTEVSMAITAILGAFGLYKAIDPGK